jgi:large subunit ribosomal protein L15
MSTKQFKPAKGSIKNSKRRGRGNASGLGGECGRGHKGQKSRSGFKSKPGFEGGQTPLYRRLPKKRGMNNMFRIAYQAVNLAKVNEIFTEGEVVDKESLVAKGLLSRNDNLKILGDGVLEKKLKFVADKFSKSAIEKIEKSGGSYRLSASNE